MTHSRRDAMKLFGAGVATVALPGASFAATRGGAAFFGLREVRLGEGPFLAAQKLDE
jgi:hypothetical protein